MSLIRCLLLHILRVSSVVMGFVTHLPIFVFLLLRKGRKGTKYLLAKYKLSILGHRTRAEFDVCSNQ